MCFISRPSIPSVASTARAATTALRRRARRSRQPLCDRLQPRADMTRVHPELGTLDDFRRLVQACADHGLEIALDFAVQCSPDHPWLARASGMVQAPAGRLDPIRGKPAQEIRRHRQSGLLRARQRAAVESAARRGAVLGRAGGAHLSRRQSAHQAVSVLGVAYSRSPDRRSRGHLPVRGFYPTQSDEGAGQARLQPVLHLLHLAHEQG